jgi:hypothetical protein
MIQGLNKEDQKLLRLGTYHEVGDSGYQWPTFGEETDFVEMWVYDVDGTYIEKKIVEYEDLQLDSSGLRLNPGADLRKLGYNKGRYNVKYNFFRRLAGSDEVVLMKINPDEYGEIYNESYWVDEDGKIYAGSEEDKENGEIGEELVIKDYGYWIHKISPDRKEVRLAPYDIISDKYKKDFSLLPETHLSHTPVKEDEYGKIQFITSDEGETVLRVTKKPEVDPGFTKQMVGGTVIINNAFVVHEERNVIPILVEDESSLPTEVTEGIPPVHTVEETRGWVTTSGVLPWAPPKPAPPPEYSTGFKVISPISGKSFGKGDVVMPVWRSNFIPKGDDENESGFIKISLWDGKLNKWKVIEDEYPNTGRYHRGIRISDRTNFPNRNDYRIRLELLRVGAIPITKNVYTDSAPFSVDITYPPNITNQPTSSSTRVRPGRSFSIHGLRVTGVGLSYAWYRGGSKLPNGGRYGSNTPTLRINNSRYSDEGNYSCKITNAGGTVTTKTVYIDINSPWNPFD